LDLAEQEVQAAINAAGNLLPTDLPAPPIYSKVNPADAPVLILGLTSKTLPLTQVEDLADTRLAQKISQLTGVGLVSISGGHRPAVRIQADLRQLAAYGLNIDDLRTTLSTANVNTPKGNFDGPTRSYTINANDQLKKASDYNELVIAYRNGAPVKLSDVAKATEGAENTRLAGWMNTTEAIIPSLSVPLSLVGTLAVMYLAGFSLNNLSLMAMTIATGFVVDDAIVMIENISRYIEAGDPPLQAALRGSEQIGFTIISLTVSL